MSEESNMLEKEPLLSICILTYNRARSLELLLMALKKQVKPFISQIEIVISDNASTDDTQQVIEDAQKEIPIVYHRNAENIGMIANVMEAPKHATGRFIWLLGDDDMIIKGKLEKIIRVLEDCHLLDFVFVNSATERMAFREELITNRDCEYDTAGKLVFCSDFEDRVLPRWEDVFLLESFLSPAQYTPIVHGIIRRIRWEAQVDYVTQKLHLPFNSTLETTYPHTVVQARAMVGRAIYYIGEPCVVMGIGDQKWSDYSHFLWVVRKYDLAKLYKDLGADPRTIRKIKYDILQQNRLLLPQFLENDNHLGKEYFSMRVFIWHNRQHPVMLLNLLAGLYMPPFKKWYSYLPKPIKQMWRFTKRLITGRRSQSI